MAKMPINSGNSAADRKRGNAYARGMAGLSLPSQVKATSNAKATYAKAESALRRNKGDAKAERAANVAWNNLKLETARSNDIRAISRGETPTSGSGVNKPSPSVVKMLALEKARKKGSK
jgi:hypothetical protein